MAKKKVWERLEKETPKQYEAFCTYRDMGTNRSIRAVAEKLGKSEQLMSRWSSKNNWVFRAAEWDDEQERNEREIAQKEMEKEIRLMRKRQAETGKYMQVKAMKALSKLPIEDMKAGEISKLIDVGAKLERTARGDVGEVIEERDGGQAAPAVTFYMPSNGRDEPKEEDTDE